MYHHEIVNVSLEKALDPVFSPVLAIERPFVDHPSIDTVSVFGDDFTVSPHHLHDLAMVIEFVKVNLFIEVYPRCTSGAWHREPNEGVFTFNER